MSPTDVEAFNRSDWWRHVRLFWTRETLARRKKGCRWGILGTKDELSTDKTVVKDCKKSYTNLSITWIDYKKVYDFVSQSWLNECMYLFRKADNMRNFLEKNMEQWKLFLMSNGENLGEVDVKRGIFQGDSLSPILFVLSMVPSSLILRKVWVGKERTHAESFVVHGWFEAVFQE